MLRAVQLLDGAPVPIIGVNVGLLGYLTEVEPADARPRARALLRRPEPTRRLALEERMMLDVDVDARPATADSAAGGRSTRPCIEKPSGHTVRLLVRIDGEPFTSYAADGLIVATPTGSTAYSLSARGPVVSPRHRALLLTPVSPHMLFDRTLVLDPDETVEIEVIGHRPAMLSIDGRPVGHARRGRRRRGVAPSRETARFVRFGGAASTRS